jgi:hypothetical protein
VNWFKVYSPLGVVVHSCNTNTWEAETGGSQVWDQPGLHSETLTKKKLFWKRKEKERKVSSGDTVAIIRVRIFTNAWSLGLAESDNMLQCFLVPEYGAGPWLTEPLALCPSSWALWTLWEINCVYRRFKSSRLGLACSDSSFLSSVFPGHSWLCC